MQKRKKKINKQPLKTSVNLNQKQGWENENVSYVIIFLTFRVKYFPPEIIRHLGVLCSASRPLESAPLLSDEGNKKATVWLSAMINQ